MKKNPQSFKIDFNINVGVYVLDHIKIFGLTFKNDGIHFLCFCFPYNIIKINQDSLQILKNVSVGKRIKSLPIRLEKLHLELKVGTENILFTVFIVFLMATFLSIFSAKTCEKIHENQIYYRIIPKYHTNEFSFQITSQISLSLFQIIKTLIIAKKENNQSKKFFVKI